MGNSNILSEWNYKYIKKKIVILIVVIYFLINKAK